MGVSRMKKAPNVRSADSVPLKFSRTPPRTIRMSAAIVVTKLPSTHIDPTAVKVRMSGHAMRTAAAFCSTDDDSIVRTGVAVLRASIAA